MNESLNSTDAAVEQLLAEYLQAAERGEAPDRESFLSAHPQLAGELREFLDDQDRLCRLVEGHGRHSQDVVPASSDGASVRYFGDYELLDEIARGGMGVVYKARQVSLNRVVALKMILSGQFASADDVKRFQVEAQNAAQLDHPNIVPIYEVGRHRGHHYYTMKLVEGGSLAQRVAEFAGDPRAAARLIVLVARAVQYAHDRAILHRDLKPGNILLDAQGRPQVTDFGLARRLEAEPGLTCSGAIVGSPRYMAPEQAAGEKVLTVAADVYALGSILYELLTGAPPFREETVLATLQRVREAEPVRPLSLNCRLDRDLETVCLKCLRKEAHQRYPSAGALADDLERWLRGEPVRARRSSAAERTWRWCRRNRAVAVSVAAVAALFVTMSYAGWRLHRAAEESRIRAAAAQKERSARVTTIADMQAHSGLLADQRNDARQALLWFAYAARTAADEPSRYTTNELRVRSWARRVASPLAAFMHGSGPSADLLFNQPGSMLLIRDEHGHASVWDWVHERPVTPAAKIGKVTAAAWSPDGRWLALAKESGVELQPISQAGAALRIPGTSGSTCVCFQPGPGRLLAIGGTGVTLWDVAAEQPAGQVVLAGPVTSVAFSPEGDRLVAVGLHQVRVIALEGGRPQEMFIVPALVTRNSSDAEPTDAFFQDEGRSLVTVVPLPRGGRCLTWLDARTGVERHSALCGPPGVIVASPDGSRFVASGSGQTRLFGDGASVEASWPAIAAVSAAFSPDGRRLALGCDDGSVYVWACDEATFVGSPIPHQGRVDSVALSSAGAVASAQADGLARVWQPGELVSSQPAGSSSQARALPSSAYQPLSRVSPDGRHVIPSGPALRRSANVPELRVYDLATGANVSASLKTKKEDPAFDVRWSPDSNQIAVARGRAVEFWDWRAGQLVTRPVAAPSPVQSFSYRPGSHPFLTTLCMRGELMVIDATTGEARVTLRGACEPAYEPRSDAFEPPYSFVTYDPSGRTLVTGGGRAELRIRDGATLTLRAQVPAERDCHDVSFSATGDTFAVVGERSVRVLSGATGARLAPPLPHPDYVFCAAFSADGAWLLTACRDGVARLWDWHHGRAAVTFQHAGPVYDAQFVGGGRWVVTVGGDGVARCWEARSGDPVMPPTHLNGVGWSISEGPTGVWLSGGIFRKAALLNALKPSASWTPGDECIRCELIAGQSIDEGGAVAALTTAQWLDRWHEVRHRHPDYPVTETAGAVGAVPRVVTGPRKSALPEFSDWSIWGGTPTRNMLSPGRMPPIDWDIEAAINIRWIAALGSKSYGEPILADGVVYVGTNNESTRNPSTAGEDGGELMAFDAATGEFLWQRHTPKLPTGRVNDWPSQGICSPAYVESGRLWYCTNRCEVVCLDVSAGNHQRGQPKVLWSVDMIKTLGVFPHNMTRCAIASYGDLIYVVTGNGVDDPHAHVVAPKAPDIVCFNKNTGEVVWSDNTPGANILHGQWASPAVVTVKGRPLVVAPLGDAWVYAYDARTGKIVWRFDMNSKSAVYPQTRNEVIASPCIVGDRMYLGVGQDPEHGEGYGRLYCVDITKEGDISKELEEPEESTAAVGNGPVPIRGGARKGKPNPNSGIVWEYAQFDLNNDGKIDRSEHMNRTISTACVTPEGLCFIPDFSGFLHCLDAKTGQVYWTFDMEAAIWGSCLWADGKVYLADEDGDVKVFAADKELQVLAENNMGDAVYSTPVYVHGTLYIMTRTNLIAVATRN